MNSIDVLASIIREVDGNNTLGAGALAEAIHAHPRAQEAFAPSAPAELPDPRWFKENAFVRTADHPEGVWLPRAGKDAPPPPRVPPLDTSKLVGDPAEFSDPRYWAINDPRRIVLNDLLRRAAFQQRAEQSVEVISRNEPISKAVERIGLWERLQLWRDSVFRWPRLRPGASR